jgi:hypothetical protein
MMVTLKSSRLASGMYPLNKGADSPYVIRLLSVQPCNPTRGETIANHATAGSHINRVNEMWMGVRVLVRGVCLAIRWTLREIYAGWCGIGPIACIHM